MIYEVNIIHDWTQFTYSIGFITVMVYDNCRCLVCSWFYQSQSKWMNEYLKTWINQSIIDLLINGCNECINCLVCTSINPLIGWLIGSLVHWFITGLIESFMWLRLNRAPNELFFLLVRQTSKIITLSIFNCEKSKRARPNINQLKRN